MEKPIDEFVPFSKPALSLDEATEVLDSLRSGWITTGPKVAQFEAMFCKRLNVKNALAVSSATAAWQLLARCLNIGPGDEVILPSIIWPSMANVIENLGAKPVFGDVDPNTITLSASELEKHITANTKAILPVHFAGAAADLDAYQEVIGNRDIKIVEDAAHAIGASYKGVEVGSQSYAAIFSFHANKTITTGEGGMLVCNDQEVMARARKLTFNGIGKNAWDRLVDGDASYELREPGYKCNMMDIQAALGIQQLPKLEGFINKRRQLAKRYDSAFKALEGLQPISPTASCTAHAWHIYVVKLELTKLNVSRNEFVQKLKDQNIGVGIHFEACHMLEYYRHKYAYQASDLPISVKTGSSMVSLPLHPNLSFLEQDEIIKRISALTKALRKY